jgi:mannose-1-phosphate guanylyltransferase
MNQAFVLGAGLGTRLRPLTESVPKPLVPVGPRPLISYALEHLSRAGVERFMVNTHWRAEAYETELPPSCWPVGTEVSFRHEPVLLETAGGIANVADWFDRTRSFWVYNGDILSTLPLAAAVARHEASDDIATLILRSSGAEQVVSFDEGSGRILDLRDLLGTGIPPTHQFTGLYLCRPEFLDWLTPGQKESSRTIFLEIIRRTGRLGGVVVDDGLWMDLGDRGSYLAAHRQLAAQWPASVLVPPVTQRGMVFIGEGAVIGAGVTLEDTVVWPGGRVEDGANLTRCIVRTGQTAHGVMVDADV